jgi:hypothetical protein
MEGLEMTEKEQATFLIDTFTNLQRIKTSEDRDHEIDYQLTVTRAKLEALGIVTEDLTIKNRKQAELFANAIEESYQESLHRAPAPDMKITHLRGSEEVKNFMAKRKRTNA